MPTRRYRPACCPTENQIKFSTLPIQRAWAPLLLMMVASVVALPATAIKSISNGVEGYEFTGGDELLLVHLATDLYATSGSDDPLENITPCPAGPPATKTLVIRVAPTTPAESSEIDQMVKILEAARIGPLRVKFTISDDECVYVPELATELPLATEVSVKQPKSNRGGN